MYRHPYTKISAELLHSFNYFQIRIRIESNTKFVSRAPAHFRFFKPEFDEKLIQKWSGELLHHFHYSFIRIWTKNKTKLIWKAPAQFSLILIRTWISEFLESWRAGVINFWISEFLNRAMGPQNCQLRHGIAACAYGSFAS